MCRSEQHRALGDGRLVGEGHIAEGQAEEAGEAERLDPITDCFEMATQDLGAHVDAEHGLHPGPPVGGDPRRAPR